MFKKKLSIVAASILLTSTAYAGHWTYEGAEGPEHWGDIASEFAACSKGKTQTPIDIKGEVKASIAPIKFNYGTTASEIFNNGHTVQVTIAPGSSITVDGIEFGLKQLHFHTPSENLVHGKPFAMEMHLVHADKDGNLAVVGVMMEKGKENAVLAQLWKQMPQTKDEKIPLNATVNPSSLLPSARHYYRFDGSLTTPPCSEGVRWLVLKDPISVSEDQVEAFAKAVHEHNARPIQPVGARVIVTD
ncbi:Carbonic anhydrase [Gammaproteobacteria bacterium]